MIDFTKEIYDSYELLKESINAKLEEFKSIPREKYFYELIYCLCTPMSKAENALIVQEEFERLNFFYHPVDPLKILARPDNYIRFHNHKSEFILLAHQNFDEILKILDSTSSNFEKRTKLVETVKGLGYKEASHFLRNIGIFGLAILDRHILRNLVNFNLIDNKVSISSKNNYEKVEKIFVNTSKLCNLEVEEFDLLLWAKETGKILK